MKLKNKIAIIYKDLKLVFFLNIILCMPAGAQQTGGLTSNIIMEKPSGEDFPITALDRTSASLRYDINDYKGVIRAIGNLQMELKVLLM